MTQQTAGLERQERSVRRLLAALNTAAVSVRSWVGSRWNPPVLLPGYTIPRTSLSHAAARFVGYGAVALFCLIYGAAFGLFAQALLLALLVPVILLLLVVVWALPAMRVTPIRSLSWFFFAFTIVIALWPNYLAIALPGLPWVTLQRLTDGPMVLFLLMCLKSKGFTDQLGEILEAERPIWIAMCVMIVIETLSVAYSIRPLFSFSKLLLIQADCTAAFFAAAFLFARKGTAMRWAYWLWGLVSVQAFIVAWESRVQHVLWRDHIPSFLKVEDPTVQAILANGVRLYTGKYRAQGTFDGPIQLGEFTTLCFAFVIHFALAGRTLRTRVLAWISAPLLLTLTLLCASRSGAVGLLGTILMYAFVHSVRLWRRDRASLMGPLMALAYPIGGALTVMATFFVGRLHAIVWGNSATQAASTQARYDQMSMGMPKIIKRPWGYGVDTSAEVVGWVSASGQLSIDNYYLSTVVDFGIQGLVTFVFLFGYSIVKSTWYAITMPNRDAEIELLAPAAVALANFMVVKSVFSQQDNHPLFYAVLGMVVALIYRAKKEAAAEAAEAATRSKPLSRPSPVLVGARR